MYDFSRWICAAIFICVLNSVASCGLVVQDIMFAQIMTVEVLFL